MTTLGRDLGSSVVLDDPFASAQHAVLTFRGRAWYVEDLGSTNGTYVNGDAGRGIAPLGYGDEIQIGEVRLRLERGRGVTGWRSRVPALPPCPGFPRPPRPGGASCASSCRSWPPSRWAASRSASRGPAASSSPTRPALGALRRRRSWRPTSPWSLAGRRIDEVLLPAAACSAGSGSSSWSACRRTSSSRTSGPWTLGLGDLQLLWLGLALAVATTVAIVVRSDRWLRLYKYTWAAVGVGRSWR